MFPVILGVVKVETPVPPANIVPPVSVVYQSRVAPALGDVVKVTVPVPQREAVTVVTVGNGLTTIFVVLSEGNVELHPVVPPVFKDTIVIDVVPEEANAPIEKPLQLSGRIIAIYPAIIEEAFSSTMDNYRKYIASYNFVINLASPELRVKRCSR